MNVPGKTPNPEPELGYRQDGALSAAALDPYGTSGDYDDLGSPMRKELPEIDGPVLVLGAGWVGSRLAARLSDIGVEVSATNRPNWQSRRKEGYFAPAPLADRPVTRFTFDIADRSTWAGLPDPSTVGTAILTFAPSLEDASAFWDAYLGRVPRVISYSTTSVYRVDTPGQKVDEGTSLHTARAEVDAYMQQRGATILTISGIFGEPRSTRGVCTCLDVYARMGARYGSMLKGQKKINMVHVDDIITATAHALNDDSTVGKRFNVAGLNFCLHELMHHCKYPQAEQAESEVDTDPTSKVVSSDKLLTEVLPPSFNFIHALKPTEQTEPDVSAALAATKA